jgi:DNA (cytosine-5)-methyltransferase 1
MRPKSGLPKRRALRRMPEFTHGLKDNVEFCNAREAVDPTIGVMSMFSGCGGMDLGFLGGFNYGGKTYAALPFRILHAVDVDPKSIQTYKLNIDNQAAVGDLTQISSSDLPKARVLIGGFPCQDFSSSGPKTGFSGERGQLYACMVEYMRVHQPDMVVGENVPHLATLHGGQYLKAIIRDFEAEGYNFVVWNIFGPDYGLSQSRRRLFLVGVRRELGYPPMPPKPTHQEMHIPIDVALKDLEKITDEAVTNQSQYFVATRATAGGGQGDHTNQRGKVAYCIRANAKARIQFHYSLDRRLTVRECARLQSFPDGFVFPFASMTNMTQIGNAVPPILAHHVATIVCDHINRVDRGEKNHIPWPGTTHRDRVVSVNTQQGSLFAIEGECA